MLRRHRFLGARKLFAAPMVSMQQSAIVAVFIDIRPIAQQLLA